MQISLRPIAFAGARLVIGGLTSPGGRRRVYSHGDARETCEAFVSRSSPAHDVARRPWRLCRRLQSTVSLGVLAAALAAELPRAARAQQVVANGTTQTASGTINTGVLPPITGYALYSFNGGVIQSFSPLTLRTGGAGSHAAVAESGGSINIFNGSSITRPEAPRRGSPPRASTRSSQPPTSPYRRRASAQEPTMAP
jgi:hypothetical protein